MRIDPHVHCRDGKESHKETIAHAFNLCDSQGVDIIFDMPNTDPPILTPRDVESRLKLVPESARDRYRLYIAATTDERQLASAAAMAMESDQVIGLKLYTGEGVGTLSVAEEDAQRRIYEILAGTSYTGVLAVHCEKNALIAKSFDPNDPCSHTRARPVAAETSSIADQIRFASSANFKGALHICHVSTAESVYLVDEARKKLNITCGATPHHLIWSSDHYRRPDGSLYKVNPPLREPGIMIALRDALKHGMIDWIESDHAPHALSEKLHPPYSSGYPSLCLYRYLVEDLLPAWGLNEKTIENLTCANIARAFGERKVRHEHIRS